MAVERIGLIGLGLLGTALAGRLMASGLTVAGFDIEGSRRDALQSIGGQCVGSPAEVASMCRRTVLSLPNSEVVHDVITEMEPHLLRGAIVIDTTTGDPQDAEDAARRLEEREVAYLEATIGGSSRQVETGDAIVMAGGDRVVYEQCGDILSSFTKQPFFVGRCGSGARMKLVFNLALGLNRAVLAEALSFAVHCGLSAERVLEILKTGPAFSEVMNAKGRKMVTGDHRPEARLSQHLKDVRLMLTAAERCGAKLPLSEAHCKLLERAEAAGHGASDNSAIIEAFDS